MESEKLKKIYPWPEHLYKFRGRGGLATYKHIGDGVYQDTTCFDHVNCQITVKPVDEHFELDELVNDSAKKNDYYHKPYDGPVPHFYTDEKMVLRKVLEFQIEDADKKIAEYTEKLSAAKAEVSKLKKRKLRPQVIANIDYDDEIIIVKDLSYLKRPKTQKIEYKVSNKFGIQYLLTTEEFKVYNSDTEQALAVIHEYWDDLENYHYDNFHGFCSQKDFDDFCFNAEVDEKKNTAKGYGSTIQHYKELKEDRLQKLNEL